MKLTYASFVLSIFVLLTSCTENEILDETIIFQDSDIFILASETENFITIKVEALSDITDNRGGSTNKADYCNISFDINSNNEIDNEIDFGYESPTKNYDICSYYFLNDESITHCAGHLTTAIFLESFSTSTESTTPHMTWELIISKEELNYNRNLSFTVKTIDKGQFKTYPKHVNDTNPIQFFFKKTLNFKW